MTAFKKTLVTSFIVSLSLLTGCPHTTTVFVPTLPTVYQPGVMLSAEYPGKIVWKPTDYPDIAIYIEENVCIGGQDAKKYKGFKIFYANKTGDKSVSCTISKEFLKSKSSQAFYYRVKYLKVRHGLHPTGVDDGDGVDSGPLQGHVGKCASCWGQSRDLAPRNDQPVEASEAMTPPQQSTDKADTWGAISLVCNGSALTPDPNPFKAGVEGDMIGWVAGGSSFKVVFDDNDKSGCKLTPPSSTTTDIKINQLCTLGPALPPGKFYSYTATVYSATGGAICSGKGQVMVQPTQ